ncbi:MAG: hypothetical protein GX335_05425 [Firmicutes bacterium]|nr:hypothetical protein [Bacillota bacterium]
MNKKKIIAPLIVTCILVFLFAGQLRAVLRFYLPTGIKVVAVISLLALVAVSIAVFWERVKEIRSGEEDDLGKY